MTTILRLANEIGTEPYDLIGGALRATLNLYYENMTTSGLLERRYGLYASTMTHTNIEIMEAYKRLEAIEARIKNKRQRPFEGKSWWLEEGAASEVPYKRAVIYDLSLRRQYMPGISDPLFSEGHDYMVGEISIVTDPENESSVLRTAVPAASVSVLGGFVRFGAGGTREGRVALLSLQPPFATYAYNAWVGVRPEAEGSDDFNPLVSFSSNTPALAGVTLVADTNAANGTAVQIDHSAVATPTTMTPRHLTTLALAHSGANLAHWHGRYRAILRYKIVGTAAQIAVKVYYGTVSLGSLDVGIPLETVYLSGTSGLYRLADMGEITLPFYGNYSSRLLDVLSADDDCGFLAATEFIDGAAATDHLTLDAIILVPAERLATCANFDQVFTAVNWLMNEYGVTAVLGSYGYAVEGKNSLRLPSEGGVIVVLVEDLAGSKKTDAVDLTVKSYNRYGRYAGNG